MAGNFWQTYFQGMETHANQCVKGHAAWPWQKFSKLISTAWKYNDFMEEQPAPGLARGGVLQAKLSESGCALNTCSLPAGPKSMCAGGWSW